jgi:hypothetical protein
MTVYLMTSLQKIPNIHRIYRVLANPMYVYFLCICAAQALAPAQVQLNIRSGELLICAHVTSFVYVYNTHFFVYVLIQKSLCMYL